MRFLRGPLSRAVLALAITGLAASCEGAVLGPGPDGAPRGALEMTVQAFVTSTMVTGLSVEVTGPGIRVPVIANLALANGIATGSVQVAAGGRRTFTMRAYDEDAVETHRGSATVPIREGANAAVALTLEPLIGTVPIEGVIGTYSLEIHPTDVVLRVGETQPFSLVVRDIWDNPIPDPELTWGSLNPAVATVDEAGLATARHAGETPIAASYNGFAAAARVTVERGRE